MQPRRFLPRGHTGARASVARLGAEEDAGCERRLGSRRPLIVASLLAVAQLAKGGHEQVAATMARLAERGEPHAQRV